MRKPKSPLFAIFLTIFIDLLGIGILIPVIPQLLANPESPQYLLGPGWSVEGGYLLLGALITVYPLAQFFAAPLLGQFSDRYGRRPILIASIAGTAFGYALFAIAIHLGSIPLLFISRAIDGLTGGNISVAQAAIADVTAPKDRAKNFGLMGAVFGLGFIMGPYIGGQLANNNLVSWFDASVPFWFAAFISIVNAILISILFVETHPKKSTAALDWGQSLHHIVKAFTGKLKTFFMIGFLYQAGFGFMVTFFGVFLIERFGFVEADTGNLFAYIGIWIAFTQAVLTRAMAKRFSERKILSITLPMTGVATLLFLLPGPWTNMLFIIPIFAIFNGLAQSNFMAFLSRSAGPEVQGEILGINASVAALSQAIPPIISGVIAAESSPATSILVASVMIITAGLLFFALIRHDPPAHGETDLPPLH